MESLRNRIYRLPLIRGVLARLDALERRSVAVQRLAAALQTEVAELQSRVSGVGGHSAALAGPGLLPPRLNQEQVAFDKETPVDEYTDWCLRAFGKDISLGVEWMFWSFPRESEESKEVVSAMWSVETKLWRKYLQCIQREEIEGSLVEFGVAEGMGLEHLVSSCEQIGLKMSIFGFDSFQGLPKVSTDNDLPFFKEGMFAASYQAVQERLRVYSRPYLHLIPGWFSESLHSVDVGKVAFARIDCDLYESADDCLKYIEDRLSNGAFLIFDNWAHSHRLGESKAFFEFWERTKHRLRFEHLASVAYGGCHFRVWLL